MIQPFLSMACCCSFVRNRRGELCACFGIDVQAARSAPIGKRFGIDEGAYDDVPFAAQLLFSLFGPHQPDVKIRALPDAQSIVAAVLSADAEHGDISREIYAALADGKLTEHERAAISRQIRDAHQALDALNSTVLHAPTILKQA